MAYSWAVPRANGMACWSGYGIAVMLSTGLLPASTEQYKSTPQVLIGKYLSRPKSSLLITGYMVTVAPLLGLRNATQHICAAWHQPGCPVDVLWEV
jgi:hypothetical protein